MPLQTFIIRRTHKQVYLLEIEAETESQAMARAQVGTIEVVIAKEGVTVKDSTDASEVELLSVE